MSGSAVGAPVTWPINWRAKCINSLWPHPSTAWGTRSHPTGISSEPANPTARMRSQQSRRLLYFYSNRVPQSGAPLWWHRRFSGHPTYNQTWCLHDPTTVMWLDSRPFRTCFQSFLSSLVCPLSPIHSLFMADLTSIMGCHRFLMRIFIRYLKVYLTLSE